MLRRHPLPRAGAPRAPAVALRSPSRPAVSNGRPYGQRAAYGPLAGHACGHGGHRHGRDARGDARPRRRRRRSADCAPGRPGPCSGPGGGPGSGPGRPPGPRAGAHARFLPVPRPGGGGHQAPLRRLRRRGGRGPRPGPGSGGALLQGSVAVSDAVRRLPHAHRGPVSGVSPGPGARGAAHRAAQRGLPQVSVRVRAGAHGAAVGHLRAGQPAPGGDRGVPAAAPLGRPAPRATRRAAVCFEGWYRGGLQPAWGARVHGARARGHRRCAGGPRLRLPAPRGPRARPGRLALHRRLGLRARNSGERGASPAIHAARAAGRGRLRPGGLHAGLPRGRPRGCPGGGPGGRPRELRACPGQAPPTVGEPQGEARARGGRAGQGPGAV
mmetsp:Transcript_25906/g.86831  ORF Transcript_25906/g.86831 Transcript_25906/m.86831 type:complete len:383 (-) Transcript_25906:136-1284(-)